MIIVSAPFPRLDLKEGGFGLPSCACFPRVFLREPKLVFVWLLQWSHPCTNVLISVVTVNQLFGRRAVSSPLKWPVINPAGVCLVLGGCL